MATVAEDHPGTTDSVTIQRGLPRHLRDQAAAVFDEAFGDKLRFAVKDEIRRVAYLEQAMDGDRAVVALAGDRLAGIMGLNAHDGHYAGGLLDKTTTLSTLRSILGLAGAVRAAVVMGMMFDHQPKPGELHIDGIAVASDVRGRGIGTRLLSEATAIGRENGFRWVRLEVVDTNHLAEALYARIGYQVTGVQYFAYMRRFIGFGGVTSMELPLDLGV